MTRANFWQKSLFFIRTSSSNNTPTKSNQSNNASKSNSTRNSSQNLSQKANLTPQSSLVDWGQYFLVWLLALFKISKSVKPQPPRPPQPSSLPCSKINTKKITMSDKFKASIEDCFSCWIDTNKIRVWSQNSLNYKHSNNLNESVELQKGTKFDLFSKNVLGRGFGIFEDCGSFLILNF